MVQAGGISKQAFLVFFSRAVERSWEAAHALFGFLVTSVYFSRNRTADNLNNFLDAADEGNVNAWDIAALISVARDIREKVGIDFLAFEYGDLIESIVDESKHHTPDHIDCPACKLFDETMNADLLGMSGQTFPEAAMVWQRVRRNSNVLRERTHESVAGYIGALDKFFNKNRMDSINPGMLKAYQLARKANAIVVDGKVKRPWKRKRRLPKWSDPNCREAHGRP
jgi:hypothetical protein